MYNIEIWKDVDGYNGMYMISSIGRVKSFNRYKDGRIMKLSSDQDGYSLVTLSINGVGKTEKVHRLVAFAFIPNPENKPIINHLKGEEKDNNTVNNLEWETHRGNRIHSYATGLQKVSEKQREASRVNISNRNRSLSKLVLNTVTGIYYTNTYEAIESMSKKISYSYLNSKLVGTNVNNTDFIFA